MITVALTSETDLEAWRGHARALCAQRVPPSEIDWQSPSASTSLFATQHAPRKLSSMSAQPVRAPRRFISLATKILCHRDPERFARLYQVLYRLQSDPAILDNPADADVVWCTERDKAVRRDRHKMHAFVRFRKVRKAKGREQYAAWFEPTHRITELAAPFFMRRFPNMDWVIVTPDRSAVWQDNQLTFEPGASREAVPEEDAVEAEWETYFSSIFNPARLKVNAMTAEMPKKYWRNLPEAKLIPGLIAQAQGVTKTMRQSAVTEANPRAVRVQARHPTIQPPPVEDVPATRDHLTCAVNACQRCTLHQHATQPVHGEGPFDASVMIIGEQPGDAEDLAGRPFVGPAGQLLDRALQDAGITRTDCYLTNAVKHFKYTPRGKRRIHNTPSTTEVDYCRWWVDLERQMVKPNVIIALGATALRSVFGRSLKVSEVRGQVTPLESGGVCLPTVHPAFVLRQRDSAAQELEFIRFVADLRKVRLAGVP